MYFDGGVAVYPRGDRAVRRHEVMHGMVDRAQENPDLQAVLPWWARSAERGSLRDELLARLASRDTSQLRDWPLGLYAEQTPRYALQYRALRPVAAPVQYAQRTLDLNPLAPASLAGTLGGMATAAALGEGD
jgi:hypothetical protein